MKQLSTKEQAKHIFEGYRIILMNDKSYLGGLTEMRSIAKENALLCMHYVLFSLSFDKDDSLEDINNSKYWIDVRKEINKL